MITATASDNKTTATCTVCVWNPDGNGYLQYRCNSALFYGTDWWHSPVSSTNTASLSATSSSSQISITVKKITGEADEAFGIHFYAADNNNYYKFTIAINGKYHFQKCVAGTFTEIIPWTASSAIVQGYDVDNTLSVYSPSGGQIALSINGTLLTTVNDGAFSAGRVSFYASNGSSPNESFPTTPEDIRFKVVSPFTYP